MGRVALKNTIFGTSVASFKKGRASHAWVISSGALDDIADDELHISEHGPVDGYTLDMSSGRGEIHGITAMSKISQLLLHFHSSSAKVEAVCDNQGAINRCASVSFRHLKTHPEKNADLFLTQQKTQESIPITLSWIKSHLDKQPWKSLEDLKDQHFSRDEI
jgi:hypothetical protein